MILRQDRVVQFSGGFAGRGELGGVGFVFSTRFILRMFLCDVLYVGLGGTTVGV